MSTVSQRFAAVCPARLPSRGRFGNPFSRFLLACVLWMAQAQGTALATCPDGWHASSDSPTAAPMCTHTCTASAGWTNKEIDVYYQPQTDPVRGFTAQGWAPSQGSFIGTFSVGSCAGIAPNGKQPIASPDGSLHLADGGWPDATAANFGGATKIPQDCYFVFHAVFPDGASFNLSVWRVAGQWTVAAPKPPADPDPPQIPIPSNNTNKAASMTVQIQNATGVGQGLLSVWLYGATLDSATTDSLGRVRFQNIISGPYAVHVAGALTNSAGQHIQIDKNVNTKLENGDDVQLTITIDDQGEIKDTKLGATSPTASNPNSEPTWLQSAATALFVPDHAHMDQVKHDLDPILNWGPFAPIAQLAALTGAATVDSSKIITLAMPSPTWVPGSENNGGHWDTTTNTSPLSFTGLTSQPLWPLFRALEGAAVWITFIYGLAHKFMPRQQI